MNHYLTFIANNVVNAPYFYLHYLQSFKIDKMSFLPKNLHFNSFSLRDESGIFK